MKLLFSSSMLLLVPILMLSGCGGLNKAEEQYNAGVDLHKQSRLNEAIAEYSQAISLDPTLAKAYHNRASAYRSLLQYERAIQDLDTLIRLEPSSDLVYLLRGSDYAKSGQLQRAIQDYDEAIRLNPHGKAYYYFARAEAYIELGQYQLAIQDLDELIRLAPTDALAHVLRMRLYTSLGKDTEAQQNLEWAVELGHDRAFLERVIAELREKH